MFFLIAFLFCSFSNAIPRYIDTQNGTDTGDCSSNTDPCKTLIYLLTQIDPTSSNETTFISGSLAGNGTNFTTIKQFNLVSSDNTSMYSIQPGNSSMDYPYYVIEINSSIRFNKAAIVQRQHVQFFSVTGGSRLAFWSCHFSTVNGITCDLSYISIVASSYLNITYSVFELVNTQANVPIISLDDSSQLLSLDTTFRQNNAGIVSLGQAYLTDTIFETITTTDNAVAPLTLGAAFSLVDCSFMNCTHGGGNGTILLKAPSGVQRTITGCVFNNNIALFGNDIYDDNNTPTSEYQISRTCSNSSTTPNGRFWLYNHTENTFLNTNCTEPAVTYIFVNGGDGGSDSGACGWRDGGGIYPGDCKTIAYAVDNVAKNLNMATTYRIVFSLTKNFTYNETQQITLESSYYYDFEPTPNADLSLKLNITFNASIPSDSFFLFAPSMPSYTIRVAIRNLTLIHSTSNFQQPNDVGTAFIKMTGDAYLVLNNVTVVFEVGKINPCVPFIQALDHGNSLTIINSSFNGFSNIYDTVLNVTDLKNVLIQNCTVSNIHALNIQPPQGITLKNQGAFLHSLNCTNVTIVSSNFSECSTNKDAGALAIFIDADPLATVTLIGTSFQNCSALGGYGGALYVALTVDAMTNFLFDSLQFKNCSATRSVNDTVLNYGNNVYLEGFQFYRTIKPVRFLNMSDQWGLNIQMNWYGIDRHRPPVRGSTIQTPETLVSYLVCANAYEQSADNCPINYCRLVRFNDTDDNTKSKVSLNDLPTALPRININRRLNAFHNNFNVKYNPHSHISSSSTSSSNSFISSSFISSSSNQHHHSLTSSPSQQLEENIVIENEEVTDEEPLHCAPLACFPLNGSLGNVVCSDNCHAQLNLNNNLTSCRLTCSPGSYFLNPDTGSCDQLACSGTPDAQNKCEHWPDCFNDGNGSCVNLCPSGKSINFTVAPPAPNDNSTTTFEYPTCVDWPNTKTFFRSQAGSVAAVIFVVVISIGLGLTCGIIFACSRRGQAKSGEAGQSFISQEDDFSLKLGGQTSTSTGGGYGSGGESSIPVTGGSHGVQASYGSL